MPKITFVSPDGDEQTVDSPAGLTLLEVARAHDIAIEGACEGSLACATCHVYVDPAWADRLPAREEDEADMLDLAAAVKKTSRLGCQILVTDALDGLKVHLPRTVVSLL